MNVDVAASALSMDRPAGRVNTARTMPLGPGPSSAVSTERPSRETAPACAQHWESRRVMALPYRRPDRQSETSGGILSPAHRTTWLSSIHSQSATSAPANALTWFSPLRASAAVTPPNSSTSTRQSVPHPSLRHWRGSDTNAGLFNVLAKARETSTRARRRSAGPQPSRSRRASGMDMLPARPACT